MSSVVDVNPFGPVQVDVYPGYPPEILILMAPVGEVQIAFETPPSIIMLGWEAATT
jgi:hypothetical protein